MSKIKTPSTLLVIFIVLLWFGWVIYMLFRLNYGSKDITIFRFGVFGDSFGALGGLFSSLALIYTAITNDSQRKQFENFKEDRKLQYHKQLYDLFFLDPKIVSAYYQIEREAVQFFPQQMLKGENNYFILMESYINPIELESSIDALLYTIDLAIGYLNAKLIDSGGSFQYRINTILSNQQISVYLDTLKLYNENRGTNEFPFENISSYRQQSVAA